MEGAWYKVLGLNRQYDCFDCQLNRFSSFSEKGQDIDRSAFIDVDFSMVAKRSNGLEQVKDFRMNERVVFDPDNFISERTGAIETSHRSAHTQGRMFGLSFWENWSAFVMFFEPALAESTVRIRYILGENTPEEAPFKFIYYTGKTLQNTYSGAFVYARSPELSPQALAHVYAIAKEAGMEPDKFCRIRNACFEKSVDKPLAVAATPLPKGSSLTDDAARRIRGMW